VLDASVALAWCFPDQRSDYTDWVADQLRLGGSEAITPPIWPYEIGNALAIAERRKRLQQADSDAFLNALRRLRIEVDIDCLDRALDNVLSNARHRVLSVYDASYLELAASEQLPLASRDRGLVQAAPLVGVALFQP